MEPFELGSIDLSIIVVYLGLIIMLGLRFAKRSTQRRRLFPGRPFLYLAAGRSVAICLQHVQRQPHRDGRQRLRDRHLRVQL